MMVPVLSYSRVIATLVVWAFIRPRLRRRLSVGGGWLSSSSTGQSVVR